jgi:exopolyphosphatase/guanosine-5'-triphosphate,3'-diphosphate pyrophosphatase
LKLLKFASIDVGSNAVRLLFTNVFITPGGPVFRKLSLLRVPLRLGEDSFRIGEISEEKADQLVKTMMSFKHLMEVHNVLDYKAYATSAMREASNQLDIIRRIKYYSGIDLEVVSGDVEAETISTEFLPEHLPRLSDAIFVDVGGGSTELTYLRKGKKKAQLSVKIGTVRLLQSTVGEAEWEQLKNWLMDQGVYHTKIPLIGTGGNINKLLKVLRTKGSEYFITTASLKKFKSELEQFDIDDRIVKFILNPDRADVIVPASEIFLKTAQWCGASRIYIPKVGLSDGIARTLYKKHRKKLNI